ncbi:MAG TPA: glycosyltransferase family 39 protein [Candidatus Didemnitutus sp.]|nr:glycosyltransferase family 39 protein [Candidatus Didemnitutus sp.]
MPTADGEETKPTAGWYSDLWPILFLFFGLVLWHWPTLVLAPGVNHDEIALNAAARNWTARGVVALSPLAEAGRTYSEAYYWHPPGHLWVMSGVYEVFGFSIESTRWVSLLSGAVAVVLVFRVLRMLQMSRNIAILSAVLFAAHPLFWWLCRSGRMDLIAIDLGLCAVLVSLRESDHAMRRAGWSGLLLGLAALFHVMILVWAPAIVLADYVRERRVRVSCTTLFLGLAALPLAIWIIAVCWRGNADAFREQFIEYQLLQRSGAGPLWRRPVEEVGLLIRQWKFLPAVLPLLAAGIMAGWAYATAHRKWAAGGLVACVFLIAFGTGKGTGAYPLYWFVWFLLTAAAGIAALPSRWRYWLTAVAIGNTVVVQLGMTTIALYQRAARDPARVDRFFAAHIQPGKIVVGPEDIWYAVEHAGSQLRIWVKPNPARHDYVVTYANEPVIAPVGYTLAAELPDTMPRIAGYYFSHTAYAYRLWIPKSLGRTPRDP